MTYCALITHVQADAEAQPRLACAVDIARRFDAALIGVGAEMIQPLAFDYGYASLEGEWITAMRASIEERLKIARKRFHEATCGFGEKASFASGMQLPVPAVAAASRAADLIVAGGAPRSLHDGYSNCSPAELALTSGRPVLVAPPEAPPLIAKTILLAWKDTREARRAMADALPFLHRAERVVVVAVCTQADAANAKTEVDDVAAALKRRGVKAEAKVVEHIHADGFQVLCQASLEGADLVVCGAYGHTRMGEWIFGGVTRDLLSQDETFLLLSH
jgi:nucleotide-binding universal stress UspA family protein